ncbi:MFS transporter [Phenylobacterium immobile]|uniref:MFS transporter n=1 Tax=Phenylobacterium immobile TaxID=21 RepID=UPI000A6F5AD8|nr:MFS transporter [Phenylobacterium immobile]
MTPAPVSGWRLWAFAGINLPLMALTIAVMVHLPRYFASHLGLPLAVVGAAFAIVRFIDIPLDPLLGLAMDRTRTRLGRYRAWALAGAPVLMLGVFVLTSATAGSQAFLVAWLFVMYLGLSMQGLAHASWASTLAPTYDQRSQVFGVITAVGVIGAAIVLIIPVVAAQTGATDAQGVQAMAGFVIAATPVFTLLALWKTPERVMSDHAEGGFALKDYLGLIVRPNVIRLLCADLLIRLGPLWMGALYLFFAKDSRGFSTTQANLLLLIYMMAGFAGAPLTALAAKRFSKHRTLMATTTAYAACMALLMTLPKGSFIAFAPFLFATGALAAGFDVTVRAITADIGDELRLDSGREWMGLLFALTNASIKIAGAVSIFVTFLALDAVGYDAGEGAANTASAIRGLEIAFLSGPILSVLIGGACFIGFRLDAARHAEIRAALEARGV